jgi:hypothetical protein
MPGWANSMRQQGYEVVVADALDSAAVELAVRSVNPEIIVDQLTSLPKDPANFATAQPVDTKLRLERGSELASFHSPLWWTPLHSAE